MSLNWIDQVDVKPIGAPNLIRLPIAVGLFLLPGWLLGRRMRSPSPTLAAFLGSSVFLFELALLLNAVGIPLDATTLELGFAAISVALLWRIPRTAFSGINSSSMAAELKDWRWLWLVPPLVALLSVAGRAIFDPLAGYDNGTRWDYLARLFLTHGSFAGYPPMTSADFESYSWCDGIPPLVPLLNLWIYATTGACAPSLTAVRVIGESLLLGTVVFRYSKLLWGERGGWPAVAALSSSALVLWGVAIGQETGLTAISLVSMCFFLELYRQSRERSFLLWAAVSAGVGALSREYGLSFPLLGLCLLAVYQYSWKEYWIFAALTICISAPWYARNWMTTGAPLYPQTLGGLFPGNPVFDEIMRGIAQERNIVSLRAVTYFAILLATLAGLVIAAGAAGALRAGRRGLNLLAGGALIAALWLWSISQTGGGWVYSTRVLLPFLTLFAIFSGWIGAHRRRLGILAAAVCLGSTLDAARRSWVLPNVPFIGLFSDYYSEWLGFHNGLQQISLNPIWPALIRVAGGRSIVVDDTAAHALITMQGGKAVALFSPLLAPTLDPRTSFHTALAHLQSNGVRFVTFSTRNSLCARSGPAHPFWNELYSLYRPAFQIENFIIFDLDHLRSAN